MSGENIWKSMTESREEKWITTHVFAVILAGGGTRLWPKSRNETPKTILRLMGKQTMIQVTAQRLRELVPWDRMIVVTNKKYATQVAELLPEIPKQNILAEPEKKILPLPCWSVPYLLTTWTLRL